MVHLNILSVPGRYKYLLLRVLCVEICQGGGKPVAAGEIPKTQRGRREEMRQSSGSPTNHHHHPSTLLLIVPWLIELIGLIIGLGDNLLRN